MFWTSDYRFQYTSVQSYLREYEKLHIMCFVLKDLDQGFPLIFSEIQLIRYFISWFTLSMVYSACKNENQTKNYTGNLSHYKKNEQLLVLIFSDFLYIS